MPKQVDTLAAGDFHHRDIVLVRNIARYLRRSSGCRHTAVDTRDDRECPVFLDIGMDAVIDKARIALIDIVRFPDAMRRSEASPIFAADIFYTAR